MICLRAFTCLLYFVHPHKTERHAPQSETPAGWYQVIRGPPPGQGGSGGLRLLGGARVEVSTTFESSCAAEMATRASTSDQPGRGHGCGTHEGSTVAKRLQSAIDVLGDRESAEAQWLGAALEEARRAVQVRPVAIQVPGIHSSFSKSVGSNGTGVG